MLGFVQMAAPMGLRHSPLPGAWQREAGVSDRPVGAAGPVTVTPLALWGHRLTGLSQERVPDQEPVKAHGSLLASEKSAPLAAEDPRPTSEKAGWVAPGQHRLPQ